jgi:hypothetical protein
MLGTLIKKRINDDQLASIFLNGIFEAVDKGFSDVADMINEDVAFVTSPNLSGEQNGQFSMIVVVANLTLLENTFETQQASRIENLVFKQLGEMMGVSAADAESKVREYQKFMTRVNHPSKNMVYAMSKAVFFKYELSEYQDEYFKRMQAPNPMLLKRLDMVMECYLWNWDSFFKKFKIEE